MNKLTIALVLASAAALPAAAQPPAPAAPAAPAASGQHPQVDQGRLMLYNQVNYNGEEYEVDAAKRSFSWDYHPRSIGIHPGDRWEICARPRFAECITLNRSVPDTTLIGIPDGRDIGSVRPAPAPGAPPAGN
jgi:hypothetical protein